VAGQFPGILLRCQSPAKINLTLRVGELGPDGFHPIESLVALIDLADTVTVCGHEDGCYGLECDEPALPSDGSNLVLRAAKVLAARANVNRGVRISLSKRIPPGSGLGGGSSNAAAALRLLNVLWQCNLPERELARLGAELGSDVPLFLHRSPCVIRGRGQQVEELPGRLSGWVALALPKLPCSTAAVYAAWDRLPVHPVRPGLPEILAALGSPEQLMERLFNDLEEAAFTVHPELRQLAKQAEAIAGAPIRMTGSGSALYRLLSRKTDAEQLATAVRDRLGMPTAVAQLIAAPPALESVDPGQER